MAFTDYRGVLRERLQDFFEGISIPQPSASDAE
jgi:hypothetical protein